MIQLQLDRRLFNRSYIKYLNEQTKTQIFFGGSSSGKSYFLAQRTIIDICNGGRNYLIVRKTLASTKKSVVNELLKCIDRFKLGQFFSFNKSDLTLTHSNGYQILIAGLDDTERIKSISPQKGIITDIWVEEATEADYTDVKQLYKRLRGRSPYKKRMVLSFNPILKTHWIYKEYFSEWQDDMKEFRKDNLLIIHTTYKNNEFLTQEDIDGLENEADEYYYNVYTLGKFGVLGEVIFKNYEVMSLDESQFEYFYHGLDFGFSKDPTAYVRLSYDRARKTLYILDEVYQTELFNNQLHSLVYPIASNQPIKADSASPQNIRELQLLGLNISACRKGKDSVMYGLNWLKQQKIVINSKCTNVKREFELAQYKKDKHGNVLNAPVDKDNHALDAIRYACEDIMQDEVIFF